MTGSKGLAWSAAELEQAREATSALLEKLGLDAYLFAIEPRESGWELTVECAVEEGWEAVLLPVDIQSLLASRTDADARARLLQTWGPKLAACRRSSGRQP
jgi:hypothetical protein